MSELRLFLVAAEIEVTYYMSEDRDYKNDLRIVWATNTTEAQEKYENLWAACDEPYGKSHYVKSTTITPALM